MSTTDSKIFLRRYPLNDEIWAPYKGRELLGLIELIRRIHLYWGTATNSPFFSVVSDDDQGLYDTFILDLEFLLVHSTLDSGFQDFIRDSVPHSFMDSDTALAMDDDLRGRMKDAFQRVISALRQEALKLGIRIHEGDTTGLFSIFDEELREIQEQNQLATLEMEIQLGLRKPKSSGELLENRAEELELTLRKLIESSLSNGWSDIPGKVRRNAIRRMKRNKATTPNEQKQELSSLAECLSYCDLADLETVMVSEPCWLSLEKYFREKSNVELRFSLLKPFRNDLAHHRSSSKVVLADANAALIWFEHAISTKITDDDELNNVPF